MKLLRRYKQVSQDELATKLGVNRSTISDWERGAQVPSIPNLEKLAIALDVSVSGLLNPGMADLNLGHQTGAVNQLGAPFGPVPLLGTVGAGNPEDHGSDIEIDENATGAVRLPLGLMALRVIGDSMAPVAVDGNYVMCDTKDPEPPNLVVCKLDPTRALFRRLSLVTRADTFILEPINIAGGQRTLEKHRDELLEVYRVVGVCFIMEGTSADERAHDGGAVDRG